MSQKAHSKEAEPNVRRWWFACLNQISDIELQRRMWLDPKNTNPHWSYIEFACTYPDDDQLQDAKERGFLGSEEFKILQEVNSALVIHTAPGGNDYDNAAVLNDPAWHDVVALAERARQRLLELVKDPTEQKILMGINER